MVLTAGRYKTKKEAQAAAKKVKAKDIEAYVKQGW
jgi:SPOR domain